MCTEDKSRLQHCLDSIIVNCSYTWNRQRRWPCFFLVFQPDNSGTCPLETRADLAFENTMEHCRKFETDNRRTTNWRYCEHDPTAKWVTARVTLGRTEIICAHSGSRDMFFIMFLRVRYEEVRVEGIGVLLFFPAGLFINRKREWMWFGEWENMYGRFYGNVLYLFEFIEARTEYVTKTILHVYS